MKKEPPRSLDTSFCPGCGLRLPGADERAKASAPVGYYHASPECRLLYADVLGREFGNAIIFGAAHQLTVDAYAVHHAGGPHPDKSIAVHLTGLHLSFEGGRKPVEIPPIHQRLATTMAKHGDRWPHFPPPLEALQLLPLTIGDVHAAGDDAELHIDTVRRWAESVWCAWVEHHAAIGEFLDRFRFD